jgi:hypothetical protein
MAAFEDLSLPERMLLTFEAEEFLFREGDPPARTATLRIPTSA